MGIGGKCATITITIYTICTIETVQYNTIQCNIQYYTLYNIQYTIQYIQYSSIHCINTVSIQYSILYTLYFIQYTIYNTLSIQYNTLYTIQYTIQYYTIHFTLYNTLYSLSLSLFFSFFFHSLVPFAADVAGLSAYRNWCTSWGPRAFAEARPAEP